MEGKKFIDNQSKIIQQDRLELYEHGSSEQTAKQIIIWNKEQEEKNKQKDFMVVGMYKSISLISYKIL